MPSPLLTPTELASAQEAYSIDNWTSDISLTAANALAASAANITFTPVFGRLCDVIGRKGANGLAIFLFTVGTAACALAPTMKWLILARFIGADLSRVFTYDPLITLRLMPQRELEEVECRQPRRSLLPTSSP